MLQSHGTVITENKKVVAILPDIAVKARWNGEILGDLTLQEQFQNTERFVECVNKYEHIKQLCEGSKTDAQLGRLIRSMVK